jgi:quercetin dioxygenase-like cupin family protein
MAHEFSTVVIGDVDPKPSAGSGTDHVDLAGELGCTEMVPKVWYLSPGDAMSYHRQAEQEEFYLPLDGPGRLRIGDEVHDVPEGTAVRIPPETPRQVLNDTEEGLHRWLIIGAPAVEDDGRPIEE